MIQRQPQREMSHCQEEQEEEVQVLECIYGERMLKLEEDPIKLRICSIAGRNVGVDLEVQFTPEYPQTAVPLLTLVVSSGRLEGGSMLAELTRAVKEEAERSLGMAMVFNLVTFIEEWLQTRTAASGGGGASSSALSACSQAASESNKSKVVDIEEQQRMAAKLDGGPVTVESFQKWWAVFSSRDLPKILQLEEKQADAIIFEQTGVMPPPRDQVLLGKLTGKQLFLQNKAKDLIVEDDDFIVEQDLYAGLDDLEIADAESE